jgi:hypothetical protein
MEWVMEDGWIGWQKERGSRNKMDLIPLAPSTGNFVAILVHGGSRVWITNSI